MLNNKFESPSFFYAVVENRLDPLKLGRCQIRIAGLHTDDLVELPIEDLPWAYPAQPITSGALNGVGDAPIGPLEGTWVIGLTRDVKGYNDLVFFATLGGIPQEISKPNLGFNDPIGRYPLKDYIAEPDTNRLTRNEKIDKTIVDLKEKNRINAFYSANVSAKLSEPVSMYDAIYPFNHVKQSESGHFFELDDSPEGERIHLFHRAGTFLEFHPNGDKVIKVQGNSTEITIKDDKVYVRGSKFVSVDGNEEVLIRGNQDVRIVGNQTINILGSQEINVEGDSAITINGDADLDVVGDKTVTVGGDYIIDVKGDYILSATNLETSALVNNMMKAGAENIRSCTGEIYTIANGNINESATKIDMNTTKLSAFSTNEVEEVTPAVIDSPPDIEKIKEYVITPFNFKTDDNPEVLVDHTNSETPPILDEAIIENLIPFEPVSCTGVVIQSDSDSLSSSFTLGNLSSGSAATSYSVKPQMGLSKEEIICNLKNVAEKCLEKIKSKYPSMLVTSGFRVGSGGSQHFKGEAVDIQFPGSDHSGYYEIAKWIAGNVDFDQMLLEYKTSGTKAPWIHISYSQSGNRKQVMTFFNHKKYSNNLTLI